MLQAGVTYLLDRGYLALQLYLDCFAASAFCLVREGQHLCYRVLAQFEVSLPSRFSFVRPARDSVIRIKSKWSSYGCNPSLCRTLLPFAFFSLPFYLFLAKMR